MNSRYLFGEAWAIARSGPRHTAIAITLIALAFYVPGLFALLARNLGRLAGGAERPVAAVLTLDPAADARAVAVPGNVLCRVLRRRLRRVGAAALVGAGVGGPGGRA